MTLTRVGQLDTLIRVPDASSPLVGRLGELARERLPDALAIALERALPEGREVVVLRRVAVDLKVEDSVGTEELAARWADAAGAATARTAAVDDNDEVARFADEAAFVAAFVGDLVAGRAWSMWHYGAFAYLRDMPLGVAVARVLADHADLLGRILGALRGDGALERTLSVLGPEDTRSIWQAAHALGPQPLDAASALPIAAAALAVATRLRLSPTRVEEPAELAAAHRRWAPQRVDWTDGGALADAVYGAVAEIARAAGRTGGAPASRDAATSAVRDLDWLDRERLAERIVALLDETPADTAIGEIADADALRETVAAIVAGDASTSGPGDVVARALRVLAALSTEDPKLAARPETLSAIERILRESAPAEVPTAAVGGVVGGGVGPSTEEGSTWRRCDAAGVLLLARALSDTRLAALASRLGLPAPGLDGDPAAALLLAVALAVGGPDALGDEGRLDPALPALLGRDDSVTAADVAAAWASTEAAQHRELRDELADLAAGQRLGRPVPVPDCAHPAIPALGRGTAARAAHVALMAWARWLPGLADSTPTFLLRQLLRRGGSVSVAPDAVRVVLDARPLDVVLELAGYLEPLERVPWLGSQAILIAREVA